MSRVALDIAGVRFGRLIPIERIGTKRGAALWRCQCDCGKISAHITQDLRNGTTKSCGCLSSEMASARLINNSHTETHGRSHSLEYHSWSAMRTRCYNKNCRKYPDYGGRGITVCERWRDSFQNFFEDMGERPTSAHSLDRFPDNDGNYEPTNCRWATPTEQNRNRRTRKVKS